MAKSGLIVSYYFPPVGGGGVQRWTKLIKYLKNFDWKFTVIAGTPEANQPLDNSLTDDIPAGTRVIRPEVQKSPYTTHMFSSARLRNGYWQRWFSALIHITDSRSAWNVYAREAILHELGHHHYDVLIISSPPYSLAELAAEFTGRLPIPVVSDLRDPWTINPYKIHPTGFHRMRDRQKEITTINGIKVIISAYRCILNDYTQRIPGFAEKQLLFLPNGYDEQDFSVFEEINFKANQNFKIGFSGSIYSHLNKPDVLFAVLAELEKKEIAVEFHHLGTSVHDLKRMAARYGIEKRVIEWGYQPHRRCLAILSRMDALCMILDDRWRNSANTIGGKFYEYLRLKKPIIALVPENGEAGVMIRETDCGLAIGGRDTGRIARQLEGLIAGEYRFSWQGINQYSRQNQAAVLNRFLTGLIQVKAPR